jgi:hypothetical protein
MLGSFAVLTSCLPRVVTPPPETGVPAATPTPPPPQTAVEAGVRAGPAVSSLITPAKAAAALAAFRISCPSVIAREDVSGLTRPGDWRPACDAAAVLADCRCRRLLRRSFCRRRSGWRDQLRDRLF